MVLNQDDGNYPLLSESMKQGLFHPNCRHGLPTYYPELEDVSYDEKEDNSHEDDHNPNKEKELYYDRQIKRFERLEKGSISSLNIQQFAERKEDWIKKKELLISSNKNYEDITEEILKRKPINHIKERRILYSYDKDFNKYKNFYFDSNKKMKEELDYQLILEDKIKFKVYLNPKTHTESVKTPDYLIPELKGLYDLKKLDGNSENLIDNIFHKCSKQTYNLILRKNKTNYTTEEIVKQIKDIYDNKKRVGIKNVVLLDENDNLVLFYKR